MICVSIIDCSISARKSTNIVNMGTWWRSECVKMLISFTVPRWFLQGFYLSISCYLGNSFHPYLFLRRISVQCEIFHLHHGTVILIHHIHLANLMCWIPTLSEKNVIRKQNLHIHWAFGIFQYYLMQNGQLNSVWQIVKCEVISILPFQLESIVRLCST